MPKQFKTVEFEDRKKIASMYVDGAIAAEIARKIGVSASTIYAELKRGQDGVTLDRNFRPAYSPEAGPGSPSKTWKKERSGTDMNETCGRCGRRLENPIFREIGHGKTCATKLGIDSLAEIELGFAVNDKDYNTTYTGPRQILTSDAAGYEPNPDSYQEAVASSGVLARYGFSLPWYSDADFGGCAGIEARSAALAENSDGEYMPLLELENTTDTQLNAVTGNISVNGLIVYNGGRWSVDTINAGKRALVGIDLSYAADPLYAA